MFILPGFNICTLCFQHIWTLLNAFITTFAAKICDMKKELLMNLFAFLCICMLTNAKSIGERPDTVVSCNPICPEGTFFGDPSARVFPDGNIYVYGSRDESKDYWCSYDNDVLYSSNMITWTLHKNIFSSRGRNDGVQGTDALLFASDCIQRDSMYYLYFCTPDRKYSEGVSTAKSPIGPFLNGKQIKGCIGIDPTVFIDKDGQIYYFWGQNSLYGAKLNADMMSLDSSTIHQAVITDTEHHFHEGAQLFRRGDLYYLAYTSRVRKNKATCIAYSTATTPFGPYTYRGVIIDNAGCDPENWNNHGSVMEYKGKWYVFYHRSTNGTKVFRKACVEPIVFDVQGLIPEVEMTTQGVGAPLNPFQETEARTACLLEGNVFVKTFDDGEERLAGIKDGDEAVFKYFQFESEAKYLSLRVANCSGGLVRVLVDGEVVGVLHIPERARHINGKLSKPVSKGLHTVSFRFKGNDDMFEFDSFKFE